MTPLSSSGPFWSGWKGRGASKQPGVHSSDGRSPLNQQRIPLATSRESIALVSEMARHQVSCRDRETHMWGPCTSDVGRPHSLHCPAPPGTSKPPRATLVACAAAAALLACVPAGAEYEDKVAVAGEGSASASAAASVPTCSVPPLSPPLPQCGPATAPSCTLPGRTRADKYFVGRHPGAPCAADAHCKSGTCTDGRCADEKLYTLSFSVGVQGESCKWTSRGP